TRAWEFERQHGGMFWQNKSTWLKHETRFNVDRVETPLLFAVIGKSSMLATMDVLAAFRLNHRPLEYVVFPKGDHQLIRPLERLALMQSSVDWMIFWLRGQEDPDPAKVKQYSRWRALRGLSNSGG